MALECQIRWHDGAIYLFTWEIYLWAVPGGGLFDGRPETQTWVWDVFVFLPRTTKLGVSVLRDVQIPKVA
jgi:hypothetical protein